MHRPNIAFWAISVSRNFLAKHREGCDGYIAQRVLRSDKRVGTGRPVCLGCGRLVGRKAWRSVEAEVRNNRSDWRLLPFAETTYRSIIATPHQKLLCKCGCGTKGRCANQEFPDQQTQAAVRWPAERALEINKQVASEIDMQANSKTCENFYRSKSGFFYGVDPEKKMPDTKKAHAKARISAPRSRAEAAARIAALRRGQARRGCQVGLRHPVRPARETKEMHEARDERPRYTPLKVKTKMFSAAAKMLRKSWPGGDS